MSPDREDDHHDLLSVLGHELRSPLTAIRGASSLLLMAQDDLPPEKVGELLRLIESQAARMADRVEDVLVAGRLDAGRQRVLMEDVELSELVADVIESSGFAAAGGRIHLEGSLQGVRARGDLQRVSHVLRIFLDNATRFSPPGSPVEVRVEARPTWVRIEVLDRGPGVAEEEQERIFERGVKLDGSGPGAGIGLYIARGLASAMGGQAGVDPRPGGGSTFWLSLPPARK